MYGHALKQCKDDPDSLKIRLSSIVSHSFGDHGRCGDWCNYMKDPENYVHKHLPKKQPLSDENLRVKLEAVFQRFVNKAEELAPCGSSQSNESVNKVVTSKHPKDKFYCGSESLDYRVASAVCQKNRGTSYVKGVNAKLGLSPGNNKCASNF